MLNSFLKPLFSDLKTLVLDTLFPIYCLACEQEGPRFICDSCIPQLAVLPHQFCIACHKMSIGGLTHPHCQSLHTADGLVSIFDYTDDKIANILIKGKYSFLPNVYRELGALMAEKIQKDFPFLVAYSHELAYVPLNKWRQKWRGFNQSQILAETLAEELNLPVADVLLRKKFTKTQKNLKKPERIKNVNSAFYLSPLFAKEGVRGSSFILIDDVTTTGSTLHEAAKVLKRNGAAKIYCLTVARD